MKHTGLWILLAVVVLAALWYFFINNGETYSTINQPANQAGIVDTSAQEVSDVPKKEDIGQIDPETNDPIRSDDPAFDDPNEEPEAPLAPEVVVPEITPEPAATP